MFELCAVIGLLRAIHNEFSNAIDGDESRILQIAIGKLHGEFLLYLRDKFHHLHRTEPSCLEIVSFAKGVGLFFESMFCDLPSGHKPIDQPLIRRFPRRRDCFTSQWPRSAPANRRILSI